MHGQRPWKGKQNGSFPSKVDGCEPQPQHVNLRIVGQPAGGRAIVERVCLTECRYQLVLESQLPHKFVNLLFTNTKLTVLWGS